MKHDLMQLIHGHDVYTPFVPLVDHDLHGWGGHEEFFSSIIKQVCPSLIIEVGTWKGKSACTMGRVLENLTMDFYDGRTRSGNWAIETQIVCVDTWLGATEFVGSQPATKRYLHPKNGYPQVYYTFLSNVVRENLSHRIVPFPQTSTNAARFFKKANIKADLIYIDGSHEYEDVLADLYAWGDVLSEDGIMFGDDYCPYWSGVIDAVDQYADAHGLHVDSVRYANDEGAPSDYWILTKRNQEIVL